MISPCTQSKPIRMNYVIGSWAYCMVCIGSFTIAWGTWSIFDEGSTRFQEALDAAEAADINRAAAASEDGLNSGETGTILTVPSYGAVEPETFRPFVGQPQTLKEQKETLV